MSMLGRPSDRSNRDLLGMPLRITVSPRSIQAGGAEVKRRTEKDAQVVALADAAAAAKKLLDASSGS